MVKEWKNKSIDLGVLRYNEKVILAFECMDSLKDAVYVRTSCRCSSGSIDGNKVVLTFKTGSIPKHLANSENKETSFKRTVVVYYGTGENDNLEFYGRINV